MAFTLAYLPHVKGSDVTNDWRSQKCALIRASTIARLVGERRFQESDALRPDCRLVLVHQSYFPKLPKITFKKGPLRGY